MKTRDLVFVAMFAALYTVLEYLSNTLSILQMPQGGSVGLSAIAILLASYLLGFKKGLIVSLLGVSVGLMLKPPKEIFHWAQFLLDYILAFNVYAVSVFVPSLNLKGVEFPIGTLVGDVLRFFVANLAGWIFFSMYYEGNVLFGVMAYNATYIIPTAILNFVFVMALLPRLRPFLKK